jgi:hypothetical protein
MFTDFAVSGYKKVIKKERERVPKYEDLTLEKKRTWNIKKKVIIVIIRQLKPSQNHSDNT